MKTQTLKRWGRDYIAPTGGGILTALLVVLVLLAACGCVETGLRFDPNEDQKVSAQVGYDLATALAASGLPPNTPAARQLAKATRNAAVYAGPPATPQDVSDLLPPSVIGAWQLKADQIAALKIREELFSKASQLVSEKLGTLLDAMNQTEGKAVDTAPFIQRVEAIGDMTEMTLDVASGIKVPDDLQLTAAEQQRMELLDSALNKITHQAGIAAAKKPTPVEVGNSVLDGVTDTISDNPEITGLLAGVPGVGVVLGFLSARRKRRKADTLKDDKLAQANHDAETAKREAAFMRDAVTESKASAVTLAKVVEKTTEELAKSQPATKTTESTPE